jgi:AsmA family
VAALAALVLILFLFRPGIYRLRNRIAGSIGTAMGRRVELDNVRLRVLPRPGFDLEGLVIYDDPAFSHEPMMRAQEVSAVIRLRSLLRGRIEIAKLSATEPSINLVRNTEGRWNLAALLERNALIPAAPTGKAPSERRPAFPYLEASHARINFKIGQTKKSYALMDADVALWQDTENSWGARIKAAPVRTDSNLTDTGLLQINATWQRAPSLRLTPLRIAMQWQNGQLGQITKLLSGKDRGWRGGVSFAANLTGTPEALKIESQSGIDDFHRYDIVGSERERLAAGCSGQYNAVTSALTDLLCESPVSGGGKLRLRGELTLAASGPAYDLTFAAEKVPLASLARLLRQAKKQVPGDLTASGVLDAEFRARRRAADAGDAARDGWVAQWTGSGSAESVRLLSNRGKDEVAFATIPLELVNAEEQVPSLRGGRGGQATQEKEEESAEPHLRIGPVAMAINASPPVNAGGWVSPGGYRFFLHGDAELKNLFRLEDVLGLPVVRPAAEGAAKLDVSVSGPWQGFAPPVTLGAAQLRSVRAEMRGLNTPIEISSATMTLAPDAVRMYGISARTGSTHWSGGVAAPRHCAAPGVASGVASGIALSVPASNCVFQFDLKADELSTADLTEWLTPHPAKRPWYRILKWNSNAPPGASPLLGIQAHGNLLVDRLLLKKLMATQVSTRVDVDRGKITLTGLRAQLLQGSHQGDWTIDLASHDGPDHDAANQPMHYHGTGALQNIALAQVGALMNDEWITGTADGSFDFDGSGGSFHEVLAGAEGHLQFTMRNGSLTHIEMAGSGALPVHRFTGELRLKKGVWEVSSARLESRDGVYRVSGTAATGSGLDFVLTRGDERSWNLTGTLARPRVAAAGRTEANAKPVKP